MSINNKCADCNASLKLNQMECAYCGAVQKDFNEQLLNELMAIKRKYELANARGNKLVMEPLMADEYTYTLSDGGVVEEPISKKSLLENAPVDENFVSYAISNEELIARTSERAKMNCVQTIVRRTPFSEYDPYIFRTELEFVWRDGRWQIASERCVSIDEEGNEIL